MGEKVFRWPPGRVDESFLALFNNIYIYICVYICNIYIYMYVCVYIYISRNLIQTLGLIWALLFGSQDSGVREPGFLGSEWELRG